MATIRPLRALRPRDDLAAQVASVPYDVVNRDEARRLAAGNPRSFLHVTKPEIDLRDDVDPHDDAVYQQGARALRAMIDGGTLVRDDAACLYAYALTWKGRTQTGIVLGASVAEYDRNIVRRHEHTRPDKEDDRVRHMEALGAQSGIVFLVHPDHDVIAGVIAEASASPPPVDFTAPDGVRHRVWPIADPGRIEALVGGFAEVGPLYIADGHHRSKAASRVAGARGQRDATFLAVSFPVSEVEILPYNRVVRDLQGRDPAAFLAGVAERLDVSEGRPQPARRGSFGMLLDGRWYALTVRPGTFDASDPVARLDVSILQEQVLAPMLGIDDPRTNQRIDFVGGIRGTAELERRCREGWAVAFEMHPTSMQDLLAIADAGEVMPPKSTWFEPKLRDGLFVSPLE